MDAIAGLSVDLFEGIVRRQKQTWGMCIYCHLQSGVAEHTLGPELGWGYQDLWNPISDGRFLMVLGLDFQDPQQSLG